MLDEIAAKLSGYDNLALRSVAQALRGEDPVLQLEIKRKRMGRPRRGTHYPKRLELSLEWLELAVEMGGRGIRKSRSSLKSQPKLALVGQQSSLGLKMRRPTWILYAVCMATIAPWAT